MWCKRLCLMLGVVGGLTQVASAQTQVRPRVMIVLDTSGSMTGTFNDARTRSDGSTTYQGPGFPEAIFAYPGVGSLTSATQCPATNPDNNPGYQSRAATAKRAIRNVVNATGDVDWGLMRFSATQCAPSTSDTGGNSHLVGTSGTTCNSDYDCAGSEYCVTPTGSAQKRCRRPRNLCADPDFGTGSYTYEYARPASLDDGLICVNAIPDAQHLLRATVGSDDCGTAHDASTAGYCGNVKTCTTDAQCNNVAGACQAQANSPVKVCTCGTCPSGYACSSGVCRYNENCYGQNSTNSSLLVDAGAGADQILLWTDGREVWDTTGPTNPEVRFIQSGTPLGGALRTAGLWYNGVTDTSKTCRPYSVVLITDGEDNCRQNSGRGPVSGAESFVASTIANARVANKVYVIGIAASTSLQATLNSIAVAGGTGSARFSNNQADIEAALADVISESILFEKCNGIDDNCNGLIDEGFGIYKECTGTTNCNAGRTTCGSAGQPACGTGYNCTGGFCTATCTVGQGACLRNGVRQCAPDGTAQCSVVAGTPGSETNPVANGCNNIDDNCDGVIDNCTGLSPNSCTCGGCSGTPEICNGFDDDCVGGIDNNPVDVGLPCGTGRCAGTTVCTGGMLSCNGPAPIAEACNNIDDNCDGVIDNYTEKCPAVAGQCDPGVRTCVAGAFGMCTGIINGSAEICNGVDDDCDGMIDETPTDPWVGQACCPTGNAADCCVLGTFQCVGGQQRCNGAVVKQAEICDGLDNDCNGTADDVPGIGQACTSANVTTGGACRAEYQCLATPGTGPLGLTCVQIVGPSGEVCDGLDNDCNGTIDDNITNATDPRVGVEGGAPCMALPAGQMMPPCKPGTTVCVAGVIECSGYVGPQPNLCDGISRDCTGVPNTAGNCPAGFECFQGNCVAPCAGGEFPCLGGFVCVDGLCIPDVCTKAMCPAGQLCELAADGSAVCKDPCENTQCGEGQVCELGVCKDTSCKTAGCPDGEVCSGSPPTCVPDPCADKICETNEYCNSTGECVRLCEQVCLDGTVCINGTCQIDPCAGKSCGTGEVCVVQNGAGVCVESLCGNNCGGSGRVCCGATCRPDPCMGRTCPVNAVCTLDPQCAPQCVASDNGPPVQIVGAGGGGVGCATGGDLGGGALFGWLLVLARVVGTRRGRKGEAQE